MIKRAGLPWASGLFAVCIATLAGLTSARADIYIIESTAPGVAVKTQLGMGDTLAVPSGAYVRAVLPSGKTQTIRGPYNGKVADLAKGVAQNPGVLEWLRGMLKSGNSTESTTGATRGLNQNKVRFSWVEVPTYVDGDICVQKGGKLLLSRTTTTRIDRVRIIDVASGERAEVSWEVGGRTAEWPANLTLRPDGVYDLFVQDRIKRRVTVRVIDKVPADDEVLPALQKLGCKLQFEAWVSERMATKG